MVKRLINWPQRDRRLDVELFKLVYGEFRVLFPLKQPIPPFDSLNSFSLQKLDSALHAISFVSKDGYVYKAGFEASAAYLYFINKSHFLFNGNKRASLYAMLGYLKLNEHFIDTSWKEVYKIAENVAKSKSKISIWPSIISFLKKSICQFNTELQYNLVFSAQAWVTSNPEIF